MEAKVGIHSQAFGETMYRTGKYPDMKKFNVVLDFEISTSGFVSYYSSSLIISEKVDCIIDILIL